MFRRWEHIATEKSHGKIVTVINIVNIGGELRSKESGLGTLGYFPGPGEHLMAFFAL